jgi:ABC-type dipeptide/oligopeptide/nickel transport system permease subunit
MVSIILKRAVHGLLATLLVVALALGVSIVLLIGLLSGVYRGEHDNDGWARPRF